MDDFIIPVDLGRLVGVKDTLSQDALINAKKVFSKTYKSSQSKSKHTNCYYCNKPCNSFCDSHTIPAFCLKYIALNGKLFHMNTIVDVPILKKDKGVKEAGTFHMICRNCDSKIFQDYESESNYDNKPTTKMLAQIAMKCNLKLISKREFEITFYDEMCKLGYSSELAKLRQTMEEIDLKEYVSAYNKAKKSSLKPFDGDYYLYTYIQLPYRIPLAFQGSVSLICDLKGNVINDVYNRDARYEIKNVYLCLFPFKSKSIIMLFIEKGNKRYSSFFKQFKKLPLSEQLKVINYIVFAYTEDYFISPSVPEETLKQLLKAARKSTDLISSTPFVNLIDIANEYYSFDEMQTIPNILSEEFQIRTDPNMTSI